MHDKLSFHKVIAVRDSFVWIVDHFLNQLRPEIGKFIDSLNVVSAFGHTEWDLKEKFFD